MDLYNSDSEYEAQKRKNKQKDCKDAALKYTLLCISTILGIGIALCTGFSSITSRVLWYGSFRYGLYFFMAIAFINFLFFGLVLCTLRKQEEGFLKAGISYILYSILYYLGRYSFEDTWYGSIFMIGGVVLGLIYIYNFIASTGDILYGVDNYLAMCWDTYRKWITFILFATLGCLLLFFVPVINLIAAVGVMILGLAAIGIQIWEIVLLFKTTAAFKNFR